MIITVNPNHSFCDVFIVDKTSYRV